METELVRNMSDFNEKVIDHFGCLKERQEKFQYKWIVSALFNGELCLTLRILNCKELYCLYIAIQMFTEYVLKIFD